MEYVVAVLLIAVVYLLYQNHLLVKEQNWQNDFLAILDRDLKKAEIMNDVNITMEVQDEVS